MCISEYRSALLVICLLEEATRCIAVVLLTRRIFLHHCLSETSLKEAILHNHLFPVGCQYMIHSYLQTRPNLFFPISSSQRIICKDTGLCRGRDKKDRNKYHDRLCLLFIQFPYRFQANSILVPFIFFSLIIECNYVHPTLSLGESGNSKFVIPISVSIVTWYPIGH